MADQREEAGSAQPRAGVLDAETSGQEARWAPPENGDPGRWKKLVLGCLIAGILVFVIAPAVMLGILSVTGLGTAAEYRVWVGTGGTGCDLSTTGDRFPAGTEVRVIANFSPRLPAGSTVTISTERDGMDLPEERVILRIDEETGCIHGTYPSLAAGHHEVRYESDALAGPALSVEFDITAE